MGLNRDQIIKALEHCSGEIKGLCGDCPLRDDIFCNESLASYALALIKELTEEKKSISEECCNLLLKVKKLTEENERYKKFVDILGDWCWQAFDADDAGKAYDEFKKEILEEGI